jgi:diacylglycerol kinase (CTP)
MPLSKNAWKRINLPRKLWHASSGAFMVSVLIWNYPSKRLPLLILLGAVIVLFVIDVLRFGTSWGKELFKTFFGQLAGRKEDEGPNASFFYAVSLFIAVVLFEPRIAMGAIISLAIGDPVAGIIGTLFGRIRIKGKAVEGAVANFAVSFFLINVVVSSPWIALSGALAGSLVELLPIPKVDDNLSVPIVSGLAMTLVKAIIF